MFVGPEVLPFHSTVKIRKKAGSKKANIWNVSSV